MNFLNLNRPGRAFLLVSLVTFLLTGAAFIAVNSPAKAQVFFTIDLSQPDTSDVTVFGAGENDHLTGNGAPDTFTDLTRAHAIVTGDFNCDGIEDIALGAPDADPTVEAVTRTDAGAVYIIFGRIAPFPANIDAEPTALTRPDVTIFGAAAGESASADNLGFALASGDVNGDGKDDLVIGAPGADFPGSAEPAVDPRMDTGAVFVILSSIDLTTGTAIDIGANNAEDADAAIYGTGTGDRFGSALDVGNVGGPTANQQQVGDIIVGAPENQGPVPATTPRPGGGAAYVIYGSAAFNPPLGGALILIDLNNAATPANAIIFGNAGDALGSSVDVGNVNAGPANDIAVGAPGSDRLAQLTPPVDAAVDTGAVFVVFGGANLIPNIGLTKRFDVASLLIQERPSITIFGVNANDHAGSCVAIGDVTGDGVPDLNIGAPDADGPPNSARAESGEAYVIEGGAGLNPPQNSVERRIDLFVPNAFVILTVFGEAAGDHFGSTLATGNFNLPGNDDFIQDLFIGAPGSQTNKGAISILFGGPTLNIFFTRDIALGQDDVRIIGEANGDELGWAFDTADVDNNQAGDLIAGAPFANIEGRADAGKAYILLADDPIIPPVNQLPVVEVTTPNGQELLQGGVNFNITWTASDPDGDDTLDHFEIQLSTDSGATFNTTIANNVNGEARAFLWPVPGGVITSTARIRVIVFDEAGGQAQDESDADFTIRDLGVSVNLLTPNGGEDLKFGQVFQITWDVPDAVADQIRGFDLFLSLDSGANFEIPIQFDPIRPALGAGVRTFNWTLPTDPSFCTSSARVLVVATSIIGVRSLSFSDANFSITGIGPTVNINNMILNDARTRLVLKTFQPVTGNEVIFASDATVEISNDEAGTTFSTPNKVKVKPSGRKLKTKGEINGQSLGAFFPNGATRIIRITNPPCGILELRVQRSGGTLVQVGNP